MHKERGEQIDTLRGTVRDLLNAIEATNVQTLGKMRDLTEDEITMMTSTIRSLSLTTRNFEKETAVLRSLDFEKRTARHQAIPTAHKRTFEWIFASQDGAHSSFLTWLEHGKSPFWISGRPGAGKSTLMRFIAQHDQTALSLHSAASPSTSVLIHHYFWSAGSELQRSQEGLYRSILLQVVQKVPELAHTICDLESKTSAELSKMTWTIDQLRKAMDILACDDKIPVVFGMFLDGLDEYDGDRLELCQTLFRLSQSPRIKLCVASRSWNVFQDHFGQSGAAMIFVHELTSADIRAYVASRLTEHHRWNALSSENDAAQSLVKNIGERAQGVFLWVFMVTKLVREGLTNDDSIQDLQKRVSSLPVDLEPFFRQILDSVEPFYHEKMAGTLLIALEASEPLDAILYAISEEEYHDDDYAIKQAIKAMDPETKAARVTTFTRRLNGRCKGLLEVSGDGVVNFLHRTVRDFLRTGPMNEFLQSKTKATAHPSLSIVKAYLSLTKQSNFNDLTADEDRAGTKRIILILEALLWYANEVMLSTNGLFPLLDEMESTVTKVSAEQFPIPRGWSASEMRFLFRRQILTHGPSQYLSYKLETMPEYFIDFDVPPLTLLLQEMGEVGCESIIKLGSTRKIGALKVLLEFGSDPNEAYFPMDGTSLTTPWAHFASHILHGDESLLSGVLSRGVVRALIEHNARPNAMTMGHDSTPIPVWINFLFAVFSTTRLEKVTGEYLEVFSLLLEAGIDFDSMSIIVFLEEGLVIPTVTPWQRLGELIKKHAKKVNSNHELQSQVLAELARASGERLHWNSLLPTIRESFYPRQVEMILDAIKGMPSTNRLSRIECIGKRKNNPVGLSGRTDTTKRQKNL